MCGIIGIIGKNEVSSMLIDGLKRLEYRGYDSSGIATINNGEFKCRRAAGKIPNLQTEVAQNPAPGKIGIAHTRWATHGVPNTSNAHPHHTNKVAVVHNGIIENFHQLKEELIAKGHKFRSETDSEVVPLLISQYLDEGLQPIEATKKALSRLEGAFALAIIFAGNDNMLIGARKGAPLAVAYGEDEMFLGSDAYALAPLSNRIAYLEDGDWVVLDNKSAQFYDNNGEKVERKIRVNNSSTNLVGKDNFEHYMLKEIYEQPQVIGETINSYFDQSTKKFNFPEMKFDLAEISKITIVACGTSYYAGSVAKYWLENIARIPVEIDVASEFRYRHPVLPAKGLALFISQSGETADTLAAMQIAREQNQYVMSIVNVKDSTIYRESDISLQTLAGPEIGVASTKAYTTQLAILALFTVKLALERKVIDQNKANLLIYSLLEAPARIAEILNRSEEIAQIAEQIKNSRSILYTGRGTSHALAQEGSLKLKELSYIHAEAVAAGELKHGTIALIDENMPVIAISPSDNLLEKTISNIQEMAARGARIFVLGDENGKRRLEKQACYFMQMPVIDAFITPLVYAIPVQLLAYYVALKLGKDIDQPRNLAKSVTVE